MYFKPMPELTEEQISYFWERVSPTDNNGCRLWTGAATTRGYGHVVFNGTVYICSRIVALLTHGKPESGQVARHEVCENPPCCEPLHILWGTHSQNVQDTIRHGRPWAIGNCPDKQRGEKNHQAKLTQENVEIIRELKGELSQREIALLFGIKQPAVSRIQRGERW